ncbi:hypothetical protein [Streptomyces sp. NBC_01190]|uniref:hypothetical protein n=1 Tax=Streptomyces sp. NBC_01190 TaxID=2903767 RepID=UPI00386F9E58|nr:hypothetical protein OG519_24365 [Streptomyces sp. NBC_01190]
MRSRHARSALYGTITALALAGGAAGLPSAAAAVVDPAPIAPHQYFIGQVNGTSVDAAIKVGCFGPVIPGETGHPLAGQYVNVLPVTPPTSSQTGYTGESADRVQVAFGAASSVTTAVTLRSTVVRAAIPTTLSLPCSGTGQVAFVPLPTSSTARTSFIKVTYVNVGA